MRHHLSGLVLRPPAVPSRCVCAGHVVACRGECVPKHSFAALHPSIPTKHIDPLVSPPALNAWHYGRAGVLASGVEPR